MLLRTLLASAISTLSESSSLLLSARASSWRLRGSLGRRRDEALLPMRSSWSRERRRINPKIRINPIILVGHALAFKTASFRCGIPVLNIKLVLRFSLSNKNGVGGRSSGSRKGEGTAQKLPDGSDHVFISEGLTNEYTRHYNQHLRMNVPQRASSEQMVLVRAMGENGTREERR